MLILLLIYALTGINIIPDFPTIAVSCSEKQGRERERWVTEREDSWDEEEREMGRSQKEVEIYYKEEEER